jgi:hypothetical protein
VDYLNTADLKSNLFSIKLPLYNEAAATDPFTIDFVTDDNCRVEIYAPGGGSESFQNQRHTGKPGTGHARIVCDSGHCVIIESPGTIIDGVEIKQDSDGVSDECVRIAAAGNYTFRSVVFNAGDMVEEQDAIYYDFDGSATITLENCVLSHIGRGGVNINAQHVSGARTITVNVNSCSGFDVGDSADPDSGLITINN